MGQKHQVKLFLLDAISRYKTGFCSFAGWAARGQPALLPDPAGEGGDELPGAEERQHGLLLRQAASCSGWPSAGCPAGTLVVEQNWVMSSLVIYCSSQEVGTQPNLLSHRLNMELDLQILYELLYTAILVSWDPATTPHPPHLVEGAIGQPR